MTPSSWTLSSIHSISSGIKTAELELVAAVQRAREQGYSWEAIGRSAGVTKQAAHQKWGKAVRP